MNASIRSAMSSLSAGKNANEIPEYVAYVNRVP
jgi:hypothetical protein